MTLADRISAWIAERVRQAGQEGAVFGLSGGIDSSVVAALCQRAVGRHALGVLMPCHSLPIDEEYARLVAQKLGLRAERADLSPVFDQFLAQLPPAGDIGLAAANVKPRLRMATLYYYATLTRSLVVGSGNKSEVWVGYSTKWGDSAADIMPLGSLLKCQVRELAVELGIPDEIVARPPTAGLWEGQTDEDELGLSYADLDTAISCAETGSPADLSPAVLARVRHLHERSEHKRRLPPIFPS